MASIKVFELDFREQNLISPNLKDILGWIESDCQEMDYGDELNYKITVKLMTQAELDALPEWGSSK